MLESLSALDAYTALFGWHGFNGWWHLFSATGLYLLPFVVFIISGWVEGHKASSPIKPGAMLALQQIEIDFYRSIVVILFCLAPLITLNSGQAIPSNSNRDIPTHVQVPMWWALIVKTSEAFVAAGQALMPEGDDLRAVLHNLSGINIRDQALRAEVNEFYSQCYLPALAKYQQEKPAAAPADRRAWPEYEAIDAIDQWGEDVDWMGSHVLLETSGYYKPCSNPNVCGAGMQATTERRDWSFSWYDDNGQVTADYGRPRCDEWWSDNSHGLKQKLLTQANAQGVNLGILGGLGVSLQSLVDREAAEDSVVRALLDNTGAVATRPDLNQEKATDGLWDLLTSAGKRAITVIGTWIMNAIMEFTMDAVIVAFPMIQAFLLFILVWTMPFGLLFSGYGWEAVVNYSFAYFTISMWTVLWRLADWIDNEMIARLNDEWSVDDWIGNVANNQMMMLNLVTLSLYIVFPLAWSYMMAIAGHRTTDALNRLTERGGQQLAEQAGSKGTSLIGS
ncbi:MAG: conjugal transfer protein TraG N-terminal domain-containing protein [Gammaproteobacteria bacterium]|nr:conjugal transfer protein TraG N-terminal domain-containing protein [Gammaproteobacteria bacterium]MCP5135433.1 conjugal transfer protein TraG N-terminal domain-containing protein [Gammaproteobacteria bacterium]